MLDAIAGMVYTFMDFIPYLIQLGVDVLAALVYAAGGGVSALESMKFDGYIELIPY